MATFAGKNVRLSVCDDLVDRKERLNVTWYDLIEKGIESLEKKQKRVKESDTVAA